MPRTIKTSFLLNYRSITSSKFSIYNENALLHIPKKEPGKYLSINAVKTETGVSLKIEMMKDCKI